MNCPTCGAPLPPGVNFCPNCGEKIITSCEACGAQILPGQKFCSNCGNPAGKKNEAEPDHSASETFRPTSIEPEPDLSEIQENGLKVLASRIREAALENPDYLNGEAFFPEEERPSSRKPFFFERWSSILQVFSLALCAVLLCTAFSYANLPASSSKSASLSSSLQSLLSSDSDGSSGSQPSGSSSSSGSVSGSSGSSASGSSSGTSKKSTATTLKTYAYDGSFTGARKAAAAKDGYLVPLDSDSKLQKAISLAQSERDRGSDVVIYYVGGQRDTSGSTYYQTSKGGSGLTKNPVSVNASRWLSGEPSLVDLNNGADETVLAINYMKEYDQWYLNDVPENILTYSPEFSGKIGYIAEFEED